MTQGLFGSIGRSANLLEDHEHQKGRSNDYSPSHEVMRKDQTINSWKAVTTIISAPKEETCEAVEATSCTLCNNLVKRYAYDARFASDFDPATLELSADMGCVSCLIILNGIKRMEDDSWTLLLNVRRIYIICRNVNNDAEGTLSLEIYFHDDRPRLNLEFFSFDSHASEAILRRLTPSVHPLTTQALHWVRSRLASCSDNHNACHVENRWRTDAPKRIIYLEVLEAKSIRVHLVENIKRFYKYAAVSHCWGQQPGLMTTRATLQAHKKQIDWNSLPKTFQDCVLFAVHLDIHFLWIDSLCIVQDDDQDWQNESMKMANIYQKSFVTLAATGSMDDTQGCFHENLDEPFKLISQQNQGIAVRKAITHWSGLPVSRLCVEFPLLSRAWAFQERLLSPRILHFGKQEMIWECREMSECECGSLPERKGLTATYGGLGTRGNTLAQEFRNLVSQYSSLKLTRVSDQLPALTGICERIQAFRGVYLAGLWSDSLPLDLCWQRKEPKVRDATFQRIVSGKRPSWSWISDEGPIDYLGGNTVTNFWSDVQAQQFNPPASRPSRNPPRAEPQNQRTSEGHVPPNIDYYVYPSSQNPFGEVSSAVLRFRHARWKMVKLEYPSICVDLRDHTKYRLLEIEERDPKAGTLFSRRPMDESWAVGSGALHYQLSPDYHIGVSSEPWHISPGAKLMMLQIEPRVALVLKKSPTSPASMRFPAGSRRRAQTWERVGIVHVSRLLQDLYHIDWMREHKTGEVWIV